MDFDRFFPFVWSKKCKEEMGAEMGMERLGEEAAWAVVGELSNLGTARSGKIWEDYSMTYMQCSRNNAGGERGEMVFLWSCVSCELTIL